MNLIYKYFKSKINYKTINCKN